jgi:hypothetical protein
MKRWRLSFARKHEISFAIYSSAKYNAPVDLDTDWMLAELGIAERFGWSLEQIREMPMIDLMTVLGYMDGKNKVDRMRLM